jgi:hypothetical protein
VISNTLSLHLFYGFHYFFGCGHHSARTPEQLNRRYSAREQADILYQLTAAQFQDQYRVGLPGQLSEPVCGKWI